MVVCTTGDQHALEHLSVDPVTFTHYPTDAEPSLLGFECQAVLGARRGHYDYYGYLEDDLIVRDPWFFLKLAWFSRKLGDAFLLQPNRYEVARRGLAQGVSRRADRRVGDPPVSGTGAVLTLHSTILDAAVRFERAANPHSGCFFLNARQMDAWADRPDFLDRDTGFIGPLESAATLGILRAFQIYKPAPENAAFLEIEHHGTRFIRQLRWSGPSPAEAPEPLE